MVGNFSKTARLFSLIFLSGVESAAAYFKAGTAVAAPERQPAGVTFVLKVDEPRDEDAFRVVQGSPWW